MPMEKYKPVPLFDTLRELPGQSLPATIDLPYANQDFGLMKGFLLQYSGSEDTFNSYRRELERLAQWSWFIADKSITVLTREEIERFITFCQHPPQEWVGTKKVARFLKREGSRFPNPNWRLFVIMANKSTLHESTEIDTASYQLSSKAIQALFSTLSSFYNHLIREDITAINPIANIRQKSKFVRKHQESRQIRRLSTVQWEYVVKVAKSLAEQKPKEHERTLFIISILYLLYLRVSELASSERWQPLMRHFYQDSQGRWWFKAVGKGNKERNITVGNAMLASLKRYREHLNLSPLPSPSESTPLIPKIRGKGAIKSTREIRLIVQFCFDQAVQALLQDHKTEEAQALKCATVHWLRHTGISDDINKYGRPIAHVRDDAGHSSSAITDLYNDAELEARHKSGKDKEL